MALDPKWLEILKASGWQTAAIAVACGLFLAMDHWGWLPPPDPWMTLLAAFVCLLCGFLAAASFISNALKFFAVRKWIVRYFNNRLEKKAALQYISHMTKKEKEIIGYLLMK